MRTVLAIGLLAGLALEVPAAQIGAGASPGTVLGTVTLNRRVLVDGKPLPPGTYSVRLGQDEVKPAAGQTPGAERFVEFVRGGKVVGREVASVVQGPDAAAVLKGKGPAPGGSRVELLKGNDYVRVWLNSGGTHYLINVPPA